MATERTYGGYTKNRLHEICDRVIGGHEAHGDFWMELPIATTALIIDLEMAQERIATLEAERRELITALQRYGSYARSLEASGE